MQKVLHTANVGTFDEASIVTFERIEKLEPTTMFARIRSAFGLNGIKLVLGEPHHPNYTEVTLPNLTRAAFNRCVTLKSDGSMHAHLVNKEYTLKQRVIPSFSCVPGGKK